ncbi:MAG: molybdopterin synthase catalytic subunit MoaE [Gammaproteobacteria bacterium]|nr:molybdopterin synthase catalytic subunit MoaE [Gammaproteobacteria bacterium]
MVVVQEADFDLAVEYQKLTENNAQDGAVVTFIGRVRDFNQGQGVTGLTLEHYPGMTEKALKGIEQKAKERWPINRVTIIHRVGSLKICDQIVFVGISSPHRESAFAATEFIMDYLKNDAPFWKKETTKQGCHWVEAQQKDKDALKKW